MANTSKYYGENGVHRVSVARIAGFALNNTATNFYMIFMTYVSYYLGGFVGVATTLAGSFLMIMRIWDGATDPFIGYVVDKTNGKFGKNRPFMVIGQLILLGTSFIMFHVTHLLPKGVVIRFSFFIAISALYYIGYTFQCVVTKSAQTCLTADPNQRPLFAMFDGLYNLALYTGLAILAPKIAAKYDGSFYYVGFFHDFWVIVALGSLICTCIAVISIWPKDNSEFYGAGESVRVGLKDYWETLKNNRAIQMLIIAASTDKLANAAKTSTVTAVLFGVVVGNFEISGTLTGLIAIPSGIFVAVLIGGLVTRIGQKKALMLGTYGGILINALLAALWVFGDPKSMSNVAGNLNFGFFTIAYIILSISLGGLQGISGNIVIPMTADCADYEVYRSGKYIPGFMGTLFSLVDKIVSSFAPMIAAILYAAVGYADKLPDATAPYSVGLRNVSVFLSYGLVILGLICNIFAMKHYPLTKEKMAEIQDEIVAIKEKASQEA